jgi:uncharacterized protein (DUF305 family)
MKHSLSLGLLTLVLTGCAAAGNTPPKKAIPEKAAAADTMSMMMEDMAAELRGKTGDEFDKAFLQMMIPHHQGAIDMARVAQKNAKHVELKRMARDIISAQQREIDQMREWQKAWGYTQ